MKLRLFTVAAMLMASTAMAQAALTSDEIAMEYVNQGYTRVEIDISATHAKVEAIKGMDKLEVIYDLATGTVLKTEHELVDADDETTPGVFVRERDERWFDVDDLNGDDEDDGHRGHDDDEGHDDDHHDDHDDEDEEDDDEDEDHRGPGGGDDDSDDD